MKVEKTHVGMPTRLDINGSIVAMTLLTILLIGCRPGDDASDSSPSPSGGMPRFAPGVSTEGGVFPHKVSEEYIAQLIQAGVTSEIELTLQNEPLKWNNLKTSGGRPCSLYARFSSPLKTSADMRLIFVLPTSVTPDTRVDWEIQGVTSSGFQICREEKNLFLDIGGDEIRVRNRAFLQPLDGGQIHPNQKYILAFRVNYSGPFVVPMAVRLAASGTYPPSTTPEELARDLGLPVPLRHNDVPRWDDLESQIADGYRTRNAEMAVRAAEEQIEKFPPTRRGLFLASNLSISRGEQIRDRGEPLDPNPYFFRAAKNMRTLRDQFGKLREAEQPGLAEAFYFEAEAYASKGDKDRALASLQEAFESGYRAAQVDLARFKVIASTEELSAFMARLSNPSSPASTVDSP